jgi:uncharacterized membrane protein
MAPSPHVITHFLPGETLRKLRGLAKRMKEEEVFRDYVRKHIWVVFPACLFLILLVFVVTVVLMGIATALIEPPLSRATRLVIFAGGVVTWLAASVAMLYFYFSRLEAQARGTSRLPRPPS